MALKPLISDHVSPQVLSHIVSHFGRSKEAGFKAAFRATGSMEAAIQITRNLSMQTIINLLMSPGGPPQRSTQT